jgi:hypothetical protein
MSKTKGIKKTLLAETVELQAKHIPTFELEIILEM